ncbi:MAG TPA: hypothetical protein VH796_08870 [Nitrososphaeraceae archaeon]
MNISVDDQSPLYSFVILVGNAETSDQLNKLLTWATKIGERCRKKQCGNLWQKEWRPGKSF